MPDVARLLPMHLKIAQSSAIIHDLIYDMRYSTESVSHECQINTAVSDGILKAKHAYVNFNYDTALQSAHQILIHLLFYVII